MQRAEIGGIAQLRVGQPGVERAVAIGAEGLGRRLHPLGAFVFGMAIETGPRPRLAKGMGDRPLDAVPQAARPARTGQPFGPGVIVQILVAADAGLVLHRLERLDVAGLALVLKAVVGKAELAG